jgi:hypothetical protein
VDRSTAVDKLPKSITNPSGVVIRDPAVGVLRACDGECAKDPAAPTGATDVTGEIVARAPLTLPQLGQLIELPQKSALFENASLVVKLNADGSISGLGRRSASTAATGLAGVSAVAKDQMAATAAVNTATAASNASRLSEAQFPNAVNQALLTCLDAAAKIRAANGTPVACQ